MSEFFNSDVNPLRTRIILANCLLGFVVLLSAASLVLFACKEVYILFPEELYFFGCSGFLATSLILALISSLFRFHPAFRLGIWLVVVVVIMALSAIIATIYPQILDLFGFSRRIQIRQQRWITMIPSFFLALLVSGLLLRMSRNISVSRGKSRQATNELMQHSSKGNVLELAGWAFLSVVAFLIFVVFGQPDSKDDTGFPFLKIILVFSILAGAVSTTVFLFLIRVNWKPFFILSAWAMLGISVVFIFLYRLENPWGVDVFQLALSTTAALNGPMMYLMFVVACRLKGYRIEKNRNSVTPPINDEKKMLHPLDRDD